ncbi:ATP-binding protein [Acinetobacter suaedae]|uniref:ATP-binding protein n=1 Tax=Acinetobacter suaedae TaxID=2609668 RepID=A0A5P1URE8_9GAMM|nr:AAA family ATPase [Acinetobacter sp. C16S1]QER39174.1 ATP-binding protein [Acinetobacter sp. C16S1]
MELIIFIGCQASGKSTFFKQYFSDTHIRLNLDMLKTRHREKILFQACLDAKQKFVVDNTNPSKLDRKNYIQQAKNAHFKVIAYYFESCLDDALLRNEQREGKAKIPRVGVISTFKQLETPEFDEGFDEIYQVSIDKKYHFNIRLIEQ